MQQELRSQLGALEVVGCEPIFSEKISARVKVRPEACALAVCRCRRSPASSSSPPARTRAAALPWPASTAFWVPTARAEGGGLGAFRHMP
ncbi:hypothetical protein ACQPYK_23270 [Streptosporangium sp. CA-135522]|uniref:hypothetical protein n=1 Tax=Streptosporangium sp. CA-135522 TaxID=3240072 RepID=UPI003D8FEEC8